MKKTSSRQPSGRVKKDDQRGLARALQARHSASIFRSAKEQYDKERQRLIQDHGAQAVRSGQVRPNGPFGALASPSFVSTMSTLAEILGIENADILREWKEAQQECNTALDREDNKPPGEWDVTLLVRHAEHFGPLLFSYTREGEALFSAWVNLWEEAIQGHQKARKKYRQVCEALSKVGGGPPITRTWEEKQQQDRRRKRNFDDNVRKARERLQQEIDTAISGLPRSIMRDPQKWEAARRKIQDKKIAEACSSPDAAVKKAGEKEKAKMERELSKSKR